MANDVHITCDMGMIAYEKCLKKSPSQFSCTKSDIYDHLEARWYCSAPVMSHSRTYSRILKDLFMLARFALAGMNISSLFCVSIFSPLSGEERLLINKP